MLRTVGELHAVMARPEMLSVQLGVSAKLDFPQVKELWSGIVVAAKEQGFKHLSLDLQPSRNGLAIAVAATGRHSAKGIISLLIGVYSGRTAREIAEDDFSFVERLGLRENLSPTRANGLASMIATLRETAKKHC